jgi:hypothetical protein
MTRVKREHKKLVRRTSCSKQNLDWAAPAGRPFLLMFPGSPERGWSGSNLSLFLELVRILSHRNLDTRQKLPSLDLGTIALIPASAESDSFIHGAASIPLISGMDKSSTTTSGLSSSNFLTPDQPFSASPQTDQY